MRGLIERSPHWACTTAAKLLNSSTRCSSDERVRASSESALPLLDVVCGRWNELFWPLLFGSREPLCLANHASTSWVGRRNRAKPCAAWEPVGDVKGSGHVRKRMARTCCEIVEGLAPRSVLEEDESCLHASSMRCSSEVEMRACRSAFIDPPIDSCSRPFGSEHVDAPEFDKPSRHSSSIALAPAMSGWLCPPLSSVHKSFNTEFHTKEIPSHQCCGMCKILKK